MEPRTGHIGPRKVKRARKEWIPVTIPPLISSQMFIKAQEIREKGGRVGPKPLRYTHAHLLRRLAVCKHCGRKMTCHNSMPDGHRYYWCRGKGLHGFPLVGAKCFYPTVSAPQLDELVWAVVVSLLTDPELLICAWQKQTQMGLEETLTDEEVRILRKQITDGNNQSIRFLDAYQKGAIKIGELIARRSALDERIEKAQKKLDNIRHQSTKGLSLSDLKKNIEVVCRLILNCISGLQPIHLSL